MKDIIMFDVTEKKMFNALTDLMAARKKKHEANAKLIAFNENPKGYKSFKPEYEKIFNLEHEKREAFCELVEKYPRLAADLCERLARRIESLEEGQIQGPEQGVEADKELR